jgi:hypothetical protein
MNTLCQQVKHPGMKILLLNSALLLAGTLIPVHAQTYSVLYDFDSPQWLANPVGQLALARDGNYYAFRSREKCFLDIPFYRPVHFTR